MTRSDRHWLDAERLTVYPRILVIMFGLSAVAYAATVRDLVDFRGQSAGADFITFWAASYLGLSGRPQDAYDVSLIAAAERIAVPAGENVFAWFYPPPFFLAILPLALLPYLVALFAFVLTTLTACLVSLGRVLRRWDAAWLVAAFPGIWVCLAHGQTGFLTAALAGGGLMLLPRRPVLAGALIGLLAAFKPQLAVLFPIALVAGGSWVALLAAALTTVGAFAVSIAVLGLPTLFAWLHSVQVARAALEVGALPWAKNPSTFAAARLLGVPVEAAYAIHGAVAVAAVIAVWVVWRRKATPQLKGAMLMTATFLATPYAFDYDLVWLAFPIAWCALAGLTDGWRRWEREVLLTLFLLPALSPAIASMTRVQMAPVVLGVALRALTNRGRDPVSVGADGGA